MKKVDQHTGEFAALPEIRLKSIIYPGYPLMAKALNATGRPILFSCEWPLYLEHEQDQVLSIAHFLLRTEDFVKNATNP